MDLSEKVFLNTLNYINHELGGRTPVEENVDIATLQEVGPFRDLMNAIKVLLSEEVDSD